MNYKQLGAIILLILLLTLLISPFLDLMGYFEDNDEGQKNEVSEMSIQHKEAMNRLRKRHEGNFSDTEWKLVE